jgi:uncharacterized protein YhaN
MRIKSLQITNFGKFQNFSLTFDQRAQLFYGDNETGKTTLMSFILLMLYGDQGRETKNNTTIRRRYQPWDGGVMGGSMEFESDGIDYRVEKQFGDTARKDSVRLMDLTNGTDVLLDVKEEVGQRVLGMNQVSFKKTGFIEVPGAISGDEKDEITARLVKNLAQTGDEGVSAASVVERLEQAQYQLVSKNKKNGELVNAQSQLHKLQEARHATVKLLEEQSTTVERLKILDQQRATRERIKQALSANREIEQVNQRKQLVSALDAAEEAKSAMSTYPIEVSRTPHFLEEAKRAIAQAERDILAVRSNPYDSKPYEPVDEKQVLAAQRDSAELKDLDHVHQRVLDIIQPTDAKVQQAQSTVQQFKEQLQAAAEVVSATAGDAEAYQKAETDARQADQDIQALQSRIRRSNSRSEQAQSKQTGMLPLIGGVLIVLGLVLGIMIGSAGYIAAGLGAVILIIGVATGRNQQQTADQGMDVAATQLPQRQQAKDEAERLKAQLLPSYQQHREAADNQQKLTIQINASEVELSRALNEWQGQVVNWNETAAKLDLPALELGKTDDIVVILEQKQQILRQALDEILGANHVQTIEALSGRLEAQKIQEESVARYKARQATAQKSTKAALALFSEFEPTPETIEQAAQLYNAMAEAWRGYSAAATKVKNQRDATGLRDAKDELNRYIELAAERPSQPIANNADLEAELRTLPRNLDDQFFTLQGQISSPEHSVDELDGMIKTQQNTVERLKTRYQASVIASQYLGDALDQRRQNFAPALRNLVGEYLSQLTNGRYDTVVIPKTYALEVKSQGAYRGYGSLSTGTVAQAYLALRVAFTNLLMPAETDGLPLLLDDVLREYDKSRATMAFEFLMSQADRHQMIMFTCHNHLMRLGEEAGFAVVDL